MSRDKARVLADAADKERMIADVIAGKPVACNVCNLPLTYVRPGSGRHPGVYCANGCTEILMHFATPT